jgi:hypothetical protein
VQPEEVLELIGSASRRYDTVRAVLRYRSDGTTRRKIRERMARTEAGRRAFDISPREAQEWMENPINHPEPDGPFGWRCRAWHAGRYRQRLETEVPGGGVAISAVAGHMRFWERRVGAGPRDDDPRWFHIAHDHYWTFYALLTDEICGISGELRPLDLMVKETVVWACREAVRMVGVPGEEWDWGWDPDPLSWGADEYEVVVDAERGVLLRCASRLEGKDFDALEVEEIHFDERFPKDTFSSRRPLPWADRDHWRTS